MLVDGFQDQHSLMTKYLTHTCDHVVDKIIHVIPTYMDLIQHETAEMVIHQKVIDIHQKCIEYYDLSKMHGIL